MPRLIPIFCCPVFSSVFQSFDPSHKHQFYRQWEICWSTLQMSFLGSLQWTQCSSYPTCSILQFLTENSFCYTFSFLETHTLMNAFWLEESVATLIKTFSIKSETDRDTVQSLILHGIHSDINPCFTRHRGPLAWHAAELLLFEETYRNDNSWA